MAARGWPAGIAKAEAAVRISTACTVGCAQSAAITATMLDSRQLADSGSATQEAALTASFELAVH